MAEATEVPKLRWKPLPGEKKVGPYEHWVGSTGLPVYRGHAVQDVRTAELSWWAERECNAAFVSLQGQGSLTEGRITEIPPGKTLPPLKFGLDEIVYVVKGRGLTTTWRGDGEAKKTVEWSAHSLMLLPRNYTHQLTNTQGTESARLLHYNAFPMALGAVPDPSAFINNPDSAPGMDANEEREFFATAVAVAGRRDRAVWSGSFFPDLAVWDSLSRRESRGAAGHSVSFHFSGIPFNAHMSVFPKQTYKKTHRHGPGPFRPGALLVLVSGEGFSVMWAHDDDDAEKTIVPWQEGTVFNPPDKWWHGHYNVGLEPARYLAIQPPQVFSEHKSSSIEIQYTEEEAWVRERFESELAERGLTSLMPPEIYTDPEYRWSYREGSG